eukprot:evm.model.scf_2112.1 EVM.evm.TU.scf_2112.1   scf_2112:22741-25410(-)
MAPMRSPILGFLLVLIFTQCIACAHGQLREHLEGMEGAWIVYDYYPGSDPSGPPDNAMNVTFANPLDNVYTGSFSKDGGPELGVLTGFYSGDTGEWCGSYFCSTCSPSSTAISGALKLKPSAGGMEGIWFTYGTEGIGHSKLFRPQGDHPVV